MNDASEKKHLLGEIIKKVVTTGMGAGFMAEDVIKNMLSDGTISKETLTNALQNAKHFKDEVLKQVLQEVKQKLAPINIEQEIDRILQNYDLEVKAKIRFHKKKSDKNSKNHDT